MLFSENCYMLFLIENEDYQVKLSHWLSSCLDHSSLHIIEQKYIDEQKYMGFSK